MLRGSFRLVVGAMILLEAYDAGSGVIDGIRRFRFTIRSQGRIGLEWMVY